MSPNTLMANFKKGRVLIKDSPFSKLGVFFKLNLFYGCFWIIGDKHIYVNISG